MKTGWEWNAEAAVADAELVDRACRVLPGGSSTRSKKIFRRYARSAEGATITDTDGHTRIDMLCGLGAVSLGYVKDRYERVGVCSYPWEDEVLAAEAAVRDMCQWASWVRLLKTGSESTHAAYRIAKAVTHRETVYRLNASYHGWHEWCDDTGWVDVRPLDDNCFPSNPDVAAIFIEPRRFSVTSPDWLRALRLWCDWSGALLVFDSMIWGGRFALGGASEYYGVVPDMECFGKAIGNGASIAFVVGGDRTRERAELASGTYSGELSGLDALLSTLAVYRSEPVIDVLRLRGAHLLAGMMAVVPPDIGVVEGHPQCMRIRFNDESKGQAFSDAMRDRGVIWSPMVAMPMYAHTEAHINHVLEAAKASVATL